MEKKTNFFRKKKPTVCMMCFRMKSGSHKHISEREGLFLLIDLMSTYRKIFWESLYFFSF